MKIRNPISRYLISPNRLFEDAFLFFCFFPYLAVIPFLRTDLQPYALLTGMVLLVIWIPKRLPKPLLLLFFVLFFSVIVLVISAPGFAAIRNMSGYISLFTVSYVSFRYSLKQNTPPYRFVTIATFIWLVVGLVQIFDQDFLSFLLPRMTTTETRGVTSLAPEPSYYGITCIFILLIVEIIDHPKKKLLFFILSFQIVFLAQSSMVILFLVTLISLWTMMSFKARYLIPAACVMIVGIVAVARLDLSNTTSRVFQLMNLIGSKGLAKIIFLDASINDRIAHVFFSLKGSIESFFFPQGYTIWSEYLVDELALYKEFFWWVSTGDKIMSTYGAALYELGLIGVFIPLSVTLALHIGFKGEWKKQFIYIVLVNGMLLSAIPISFPLLGFVIGCSIAKSSARKQNLN